MYVVAGPTCKLENRVAAKEKESVYYFLPYPTLMGFFSVVPDNVRACAASSTSSSQVGHAIRLSHSVSASYAIIFAA